MQILTWLGLGMTFTKLTASIYRTVASIYTKMTAIAQSFGASGSLSDVMESLTDNIYVLLGVFMLFRIAISLLNYLIDPDKINDKSVGANKLITHIIISMVLLISAKHFIFPNLNNLQTLLLEEKDGILYKIFEVKDNPNKSDSEGQATQVKNSNPFIQTVYAAEGCDIAGIRDVTDLQEKVVGKCTEQDSGKIEAKINEALLKRFNGQTGFDKNYLVEGCDANCKKAAKNLLQSGKIKKCTTDNERNCYIVNTKMISNTSPNNSGKISSVALYGIDDGGSKHAISSISNIYLDEIVFTNANLGSSTSDMSLSNNNNNSNNNPSLKNDYDFATFQNGNVIFNFKFQIDLSIYKDATKASSWNCYYAYKKINVIEEKNETSSKVYNQNEYNDVVKISFVKKYHGSSDFSTNLYYQNSDEKVSNKSLYYYTLSSETDDKAKTSMSDSLYVLKTNSGYKIEDTYLSNQKCPPSIINVTCDGSACKSTATDSKNIQNTKDYYVFIDSNLSSKEEGLILGSLTYEELAKKVGEEIANNDAVSDNSDFNAAAEKIKYEDDGISDVGYKFAINMLSAFVSPSEQFAADNAKDEKTQAAFLSDTDTTDEWAKAIENDKKWTDSAGNVIVYQMDWIMAIIAGIAAIVLLLTICIEVVIRNLKLVLLQAISPIAFVSYMNPQDKVLNNWTKQYIGAYLDLFLKIIAITIVPQLMFKMLDLPEMTFLYKIIIIAGCLLFIKAAPNFLSKVLGIEDMAGSFKDSFGLVKAGLGVGAGAVAGGIAASSVWANGGGIGSGFKAFGAGLSGGSKWNFSGAGKSKSEGIKAGQARRSSGQSWWGAEKDAIKSKIPFVKTDAEKVAAAKGAGDAYKSLDSVLTGSLYSSNKKYEEMDKLLNSGDNAAKIASAKAFGVNTSDNAWIRAANAGDVGTQLAMIRQSWGDQVDNAKGKILFDSQINVKNKTATAFDKNIVELARAVDVSEKYTAAGSSGISSTETPADATAKLSIAKKHNKSGYTSSKI